MQQSTPETSVLIERQGAVGIITFNEPRSLNALSPGVRAGLLVATNQFCPNPEVRAILITGNGRAFCAGGDIRAMDERGPVAIRRRMQATHEWLARLLKCEKPIITAVNGVAAGAGFSLALLGDIVCAAEDASFKAGFPGIGAAPDLALAQILPRAVGLIRAKDIILSNDSIPARRGYELGFVSRLFPAASLAQESLKLAHALAAGPTLAYGLAKHLMARAYDLPLDPFLDLEASAQATAFASDDFDAGVRAFRAKGRPAFTGR